jgi:hypothetical protein
MQSLAGRRSDARGPSGPWLLSWPRSCRPRRCQGASRSRHGPSLRELWPDSDRKSLLGIAALDQAQQRRRVRRRQRARLVDHDHGTPRKRSQVAVGPFGGESLVGPSRSATRIPRVAESRRIPAYPRLSISRLVIRLPAVPRGNPLEIAAYGAIAQLAERLDRTQVGRTSVIPAHPRPQSAQTSEVAQLLILRRGRGSGGIPPLVATSAADCPGLTAIS